MSDLHHHLLSENDTLRVDKLTSFSHPDDVLADHDLTIPEKRRLLASWVSDANSVPHMPTLRQLPDGSVVKAEDILRALRTLDAGEDAARSDTSRSLSWRAPFERRRGWILRNAHRRGRGPDDDDPPPSPAYAMPRPRGGGGAVCANANPVSA